MIEAAGNLRDRLIITLLWETGCRPGELLNIRMRDVQFDNYSSIINLSGKTGDRLARVFIGKPDLIEYLNSHPNKGDPEAHLIVTNDMWHRPLCKRRLNTMITLLGQKALSKNVYPYIF